MENRHSREFRHEQRLPGGLFEFQHATDDTVNESLVEGFRGWIEADLFAL